MNNWKYYGSTDNVFWDSASTDKPSRDYIDNMNWTEININLSHVTPYIAKTQCWTDSYNLIKAINIETNKVLYWMLKNISMYTNDKYNLEYELDTWTTYNLNLLDKDINVLVDRHQDYDDENCLKFDDELLSSIDLNFKTIEQHKINFNEQNINNSIVYENNNKKIVYKNKKDILNGHFCLVINDNDSTDYSAFSFVPILGFANTTEITTSSTPNNRLELSITSSDPSKWFKFIEINVRDDIIKWYYDQLTDNKNVKVTLQADKNYDLSNYFRNIKIENYYLAILSAGTSTNKKFRINLIDSQNHLSGTTSYADPIGGVIIWTTGIINGDYTKFNYKLIFESDSSILNNYEILDNSMRNINTIIKSQNYANKINGIFIIPNIMNLTDCWSKQTINGTNVLTLDIQQQGAKIKTPIRLLENLQINNKLEFNSKIPLHKKIYKYYNCNWLNNEIDLSQFIVNNNVEFDGIINFTNSFNIIHKNSNYLLDNRVFSLPAQQPLKSDTYNKYVQANMESVNTGYAITKQQASISGIQGLFSSITSGIIGSALGGNVLGAITGGVGGISSIGSAITSVKNYEKQTRAKFADANNTRGNDLIFSATRDNLWSHLLTANEQFESVMIKELTDDSLIQLNNTLLLNGVYNPKYFKLNDLPKTTQNLGFYYAKLNTTNFNQMFSKYINETREIKDIILSNFEEFRVWDKVPSIE